MIAHEIAHISRNVSDAVNRAEPLAVEVNQNWEEETTTYVFDDGSILLVTGGQLNSYDDEMDLEEETDENNFDWVTDEMFDQELELIVEDLSPGDLMNLPGFYEVVSEAFNNEVLENLKRKKETNE